MTTDGSYSAPGVPGIDILRVTDSLLVLTADTVVTIVNIGPLVFSPNSAVVEQNDIFNFTASGGTPQYSYSVLPGDGGSIIITTGEYRAPLTPGAEIVRVTDASLNTSEATISIAPAAPTNLDVDGSIPGPQDIELTWEDNATGEDGFSIERKLSGGSYTWIADLGPDTVSYIDVLLSPNIPYSYRVRAFSSAGPVYSGYSNDDFDIPNS
jgi:hypothetical protein